METMTSFPLTEGSQRAKAAESATVGRTSNSAVSPFLGVVGLQANWVPLRVWIRGCTMSIWVMPRSHPRHSPHASFRAEMPQPSNLLTAQSWAIFICGVPTNRGPIWSKSSCPSFSNWEFSLASFKMVWITGSCSWAIKVRPLNRNKAIKREIFRIMLLLVCSKNRTIKAFKKGNDHGNGHGIYGFQAAFWARSKQGQRPHRLCSPFLYFSQQLDLSFPLAGCSQSKDFWSFFSSFFSFLANFFSFFFFPIANEQVGQK